MEEQKNNKVVKLETANKVNKAEKEENPPKYSYDELKKFCDEFYQENQYLKQQLQQASTTLRMFNRLDYLLRVIEVNNSQGNWHFSDEFMTDCMKEVEAAMAAPEKAEQENSKDK